MFLNVCYVLGMELNFLSISQIMRHIPMLDIIFSSHKCQIVDRESKKIVAVGLEDHGLYRLLDIGYALDHALVARGSSINTLWHQQYRHLNIAYLS